MNADAATPLLQPTQLAPNLTQIPHHAPLMYASDLRAADRRDHQYVADLVCHDVYLFICGLRAFSVLGLRLLNSLPRLLHDTSHNTHFGHSLKTFFLSEY